MAGESALRRSSLDPSWPFVYLVDRLIGNGLMMAEGGHITWIFQLRRVYNTNPFNHVNHVYGTSSVAYYVIYRIDQILATPDLRAASATAAATVLPTRGSNGAGMM